jgi:hypothetical protein
LIAGAASCNGDVDAIGDVEETAEDDDTGEVHPARDVLLVQAATTAPSPANPASRNASRRSSS